MTMVISQDIHQGGRAYQEDTKLVKECAGGVLLAVADGLGGEGDGDFASQQVISAIGEFLPEHLEASADYVVTMGGWMGSLNRILCQRRDKQNKRRTCSTTLILAFIKDNKVYAITVGDSHLYLYKKGAETFENHLDTGPWGNVSNCFGLYFTGSYHSYSWDMEPGDVLVLATDGLDFLVEAGTSIKSVLETSTKPEQHAWELVDRTIRVGHNHQDNVTVVTATCI